MPRFSIITPVYNTPDVALRECIDSVLEQTYDDWELILVNDASTAPSVHTTLTQYENLSPQIRVLHRDKNGGIVAASNDAADIAQGDFLVLLDHDDLLVNIALERVQDELLGNDEIDYLYTDEDKLSEDGRFIDRFNKPDWSPERLRGQNYCTHLSVIRRTTFKDVGGFRPGFDGSQDYDLILRVSEKARVIAHIPEVLYHWRVLDGSAAKSTDAKPYAYPAAVKAVAEHLARLGLNDEVAMDEQMLIQRSSHERFRPTVSIVIPTGGTVRRVWGNTVVLIEQLVEHLTSRTIYPDLEIVVVADSEVALDVLEKITAHSQVKVVEYDRPFNFAEKVNIGSRYCTGEIILALNDDIVPLHDDWIDQLVGFFEEPDVAVVGPLLLLEDFTIQSAGHFAHRGIHEAAFARSRHESGRFGILRIPAERSSVTFAAAAVRATVFDELGGLNMNLPSSYNDVDFCFKARSQGYRVVWTPHSKLVHLESASRTTSPSALDSQAISARWGQWIKGPDPYLRLFDLEMSNSPEYDDYEDWLGGEGSPLPATRPNLQSYPTVIHLSEQLTQG